MERKVAGILHGVSALQTGWTDTTIGMCPLTPGGIPEDRALRSYRQCCLLAVRGDGVGSIGGLAAITMSLKG